MEQEELILDDVKLEIEDSDEDIKLEEQISHSEEQDGQESPSVTEVGRDEDARGSGATPERWQVPRYFCCVAGCGGVSSRAAPPHQRLFMFSLPIEAERKLQWLRLIDREDLLYSRRTHHVCEAHFYFTSVVASSAGKRLQQHAIPILNLPMAGEPAGNPAWHGLAHAQCQATPRVISQQAQTTVDLLFHLPLVKALKKEINLLQKERPRGSPSKQELRLLQELCDKHMGRRFAELVRQHLRNRRPSSSNRYSADYKRYCLRLYEASPQVFEQLRELRVLPLPTPTILMRMRARAAAAAGRPRAREQREDVSASSDKEEARVGSPASSDSEQEPLAS